MARTRAQVENRLLAEINHWDGEYNRLEALERGGTFGRIRAEAASAKVRELDERLNRRLDELAKATELAAVPAVIRGIALVIPADLIDANSGGRDEQQAFARETAVVERRAVDAVLIAEKALGRNPVEMPRNNPGYDVQSADGAGRIYHIEVKGRIAGSTTFTVTANEVSFAQTQGDRHRLALVEVSSDGAKNDGLRYVTDAFGHIEPSATTRSYNEVWRDYWQRGGPPN